MNNQLQAIATLLSLVNPVICGMLFVGVEAGCSRLQQLADATKAILAISLILVVMALVGTRLLHLFGVSLDAFMVAGGGVLAWMGFSMLKGQAGPTGPAATGAASGRSLTPLILFAASPGTITGVITIAAAHTGIDFPMTALVAIGVATGVTWLVMLVVARFSSHQGHPGFVRGTMTRLMGLIVLSMGVQFALTGYHAFETGQVLR